MTARLRIALFAEGSESPPTKRGRQVLETLWNEDLGRALNLRRFDLVVPISKTHLVAMDPRNPPMSGAGEQLDQLLDRVLKKTPFDVAVVAWDLVPAWNPKGEFCRWIETVDLYRFLAESNCLPEVWRTSAGERFQELSQRATPGSRRRLPPLRPGMVLPVCMEPVFEGMLVRDEGAVRRALGIEGMAVKGWPRQGWGDAQDMRPDLSILTPAVRALRALEPKRPILRTIHGDMKTHKSEWVELLLRRLLEDKRSRSHVLSHPIARRLSELLSDR
ncbi:MAG: hypothetical protein ACJ76Y_12345 [Thermoanaerobaculia bacterium]